MINLIQCKITDKKVQKFSQYLSYLLRHNPDDISLEMNVQGYVNVGQLINNLEKFGKYSLTVSILKDIVEADSKNRYSYSEDGTMIRANQGHSMDWVNLDLAEYTPNGVLYHGTATRFLDSILEHGIKSMSRQFVHLSRDTETAITVGKRHGEPVVLEIDAVKMYNEGIRFFISTNGVVLTDYVPAAYVKVIS